MSHGWKALFVALGMSARLVAPAAAESGPILTMVGPPEPDATYEGWTVALNRITQVPAGGNYFVYHEWSDVPQQIGPQGFSLLLKAGGSTKGGHISAGTQVDGSSFSFAPEASRVDVMIPDNSSGTANSAAIQVTPRRDLADGTIVELKIGASYGPGVVYRYRVSSPAGGVGPTVTGGEDGTLTATLNCPASIGISIMPKLTCEILITSWIHNTAKPVVVSFPDEIDGFGNHKNGIQLEGRGNSDVYEWDSAPHSWAISVFACPAPSHVGGNCYSSVTAPGPTTTIILVQQGDATVELSLTMNAIGTAPLVAGTYRGCFKDPNNPFDIDGYLERSPQNTPQRCIEICASRGFRIAGVQYGESCLCGDSFNHFGEADNCTMACTGDRAQICGGMNANSVYSTGK